MATVRINDFEVNKLTTFLARRFLRRVMDEVADDARAICSRGPYATGELASGVYKEGPTVAGKLVTGRVGNDAAHALIVHSGAKIHWIFPKSAVGQIRFGERGRPQLKFFWRRVGEVVYLPHIPGAPSRIGRSHPGQKGKFFLTDPLREAARRHNMRVIT